MLFLSPYLVGHNNEEFAQLIRKIKDDPSFKEEVKKQSIEIKNFYSEEHVKKLWEDYYHRIYNKYPNKH